MPKRISWPSTPLVAHRFELFEDCRHTLALKRARRPNARAGREGSILTSVEQRSGRTWLDGTRPPLAALCAARLAAASRCGIVGIDWERIHWLALGDTDDNMRLMQVRALLHGQGWYDLRKYRLNPPGGFDIHWCRIVDLPIAGLILLLRPFVGTPEAERMACGIAPLLPLSIAMLGLGATVRRLIGPHAWPLAIALLAVRAAPSTMLMFAPERIDHHGWQLAMLSLTVAGLADPKGARGGAIVGAVERGRADDRAGDAALCRDGGRDHRAALGVGPGEARAARGLCARRSAAARALGYRAVRLQRQQRRCAATR